jgi:hypothetical protein
MTASQPDTFRKEVVDALAAAPPGSVAEHCIIDLPATEPPWHDTAFGVGAGDVITVVRHGRISLGGSELWLPSGFNVWARIGGRGPLQRGTRPSHTFVAPRDGNLELANCQPAEWIDQDGNIGDDPGIYALMSGGSTVLAIRWSPEADPVACLRAMGARATGDLACYFDGEADRLEGNPGLPPEGWEHLWYVGPSEVFSQGEESMLCTTQGDAAIICHQADMELTGDTTLSWDWKVDQLPSTQPENAFETHDYMSIAVEFDDGQDLTYHWSAALEPETTYRCPLPHWSERETHLVVRSGSEGLGQWLSESRQVLADHQAAIGGSPPNRIVGVWLIALSCMQRLEGRCTYRDIVVADGTHSLLIR